MTRTTRSASSLALFLLRRRRGDEDPLVGDLLEELESGRSPFWFWRQVLLAVLFAGSDGIDPIRPLKLVDDEDSSLLPRRTFRRRRVNLTASPIDGVGGLGLAVFGVLVAIANPAMLAVPAMGAAAGLLLGALLALGHRRRRLWTPSHRHALALPSHD